MLLSLLLDILVILLVFAFGYGVVRLILRSVSLFEYLSLSFPVGVGIYTWLLFLLSWVGVPINLLALIIVALLGSGTVAILLYFKRYQYNQRPAPIEQKSESTPRWFKRSTQGLLGVLILLMILVSLARSYAEWDPLAIWSAKGYGIALEGTVTAGQRWGWHGLAYPLNIPLMISTFKIVSGDLIPGSKLIFVLFFSSTLAGIYCFWKRKGVGDITAYLGLLLLTTVPLFFKHGSTGYANFPLAAYVALGVIWGLEGLYQDRAEALWMGGLLLGLAGWTRAEGIMFALVAALGMMLIRFALYRKSIRPWGCLTPILLIDGAWLVFAWNFFEGTQLGEAVTSMIHLLPQGTLHFFALRAIATGFLQHAFSLDYWGFLFPVTLLFILLNFNTLKPRSHPTQFNFLAITILLSMVPIGLAYVASFLTEDNAFPTFMASFDRYFFPPALLIGILGIWLAKTGKEG